MTVKFKVGAEYRIVGKFKEEPEGIRSFDLEKVLVNLGLGELIVEDEDLLSELGGPTPSERVYFDGRSYTTILLGSVSDSVRYIPDILHKFGCEWWIWSNDRGKELKIYDEAKKMVRENSTDLAERFKKRYEEMETYAEKLGKSGSPFYPRPEFVSVSISLNGKEETLLEIGEEATSFWLDYDD